MLSVQTGKFDVDAYKILGPIEVRRGPNREILQVNCVKCRCQWVDNSASPNSRAIPDFGDKQKKYVFMFERRRSAK